MKTNIFVIILCLMAALWLLMLGGCAASPNAWRDLGDGQGMRGWAGIPLRESVPMALANRPQHVYVPTQIPVFAPLPPVQPMRIPNPAPWVPIP